MYILQHSGSCPSDPPPPKKNKSILDKLLSAFLQLKLIMKAIWHFKKCDKHNFLDYVTMILINLK